MRKLSKKQVKLIIAILGVISSIVAVSSKFVSIYVVYNVYIL